jgi:hypothetical protein
MRKRTEDLVEIGRRFRWAAGRDLIRSVSLKEKRKLGR